MTQTELARTLTLPQLVLLGVGTIVGAGIYSVIGAATGLAGRAMWLSMLLAGLAASLTALSYAELVSARPRAGAEYQFMRAAFPGRPLLAYLAGFLVAFNGAATAATVALAFAGYLRGFVDAPQIPVALSLLVACTVLNMAGIRQSAWVGVMLIVVEVGGLLLMIVLGLGRGQPGEALRWVAPGQASGVFAATALVFFAYIGFEDMANLAEEARRPAQDMPRALLVSVAGTSLLYVVLVWAILSVLQPGELAASAAPLADAAARIAPWAGPIVGVAALFATASTALLVLVSIARLVFAIARAGDLPAPLARTATRRQSPWGAALFLFAAASALLPLGEVEVVASVSALGVLVVFTAVHAAVIALRLRAPDPAPPFRIPLSVRGVPVAPVLGIAANLVLITQFAPKVYLVGGIVVAAGLLLRLPLRLRRRGRS